MSRTTELTNAINQDYPYWKINQLVWKVMDINSRDDEGQQPLSCAVQKRNLAVVQLLLAHGANVEITDRYGRNYLHIALEKRAVGIASEILTRNPATDTVSSYNGTYPLGLAVALNDPHLIRLIFRSRSSRNEGPDPHAGPALLKAIVWGRLNIAYLLLALGADLHATSCDMGALDTLQHVIERLRDYQDGESRDYAKVITDYEDRLAYEAKVRSFPYFQWFESHLPASRPSMDELVDLYETLFEYGIDIRNMNEFPDIPIALIESCPIRMLQIILWQNFPLDSVIKVLNHLIGRLESHEPYVQLILRHLALYFHDTRLNLPSMPRGLLFYFRLCQKEVGVAKTHSITRVTCFDILLSPYKQAELHYTSSTVQANCQMIAELLPLFGPDFLELYQRAKSNQLLIQKSHEYLGKVIGISSLDHPSILAKITRDFTKHELRIITFYDV